MLGDFYGIFKATELLEVAFSRDSCSNDEYSVHCSKLIGIFKDTEAALLSSRIINSTEEFLRQYNVAGHFYLLVRSILSSLLCVCIHHLSKQTVLEPSKDFFGWESRQLLCIHLSILELRT